MDLIHDQIQSLLIDHHSDIGVCRRKGNSFAKQLGFDEVGAEELAIVISELVGNVIKAFVL